MVPGSAKTSRQARRSRESGRSSSFKVLSSRDSVLGHDAVRGLGGGGVLSARGGKAKAPSSARATGAAVRV